LQIHLTGRKNEKQGIVFPRVEFMEEPMVLTPLLKTCTLLALCLCTCCGPITDMRERLDPDLIPPQLLGVRTVDAGQLELSFDEPPYCRLEDLAVDPLLEVLSVQSEDCRLLIRIAPQTPGLPYQLEAVVEDEAGNGLHFLTRFYGFNGEVPQLLISEFTTRGSGNHPDAVELKVMEGGNMGGVVLYEGTPGNHDDRLIFTAFEATGGEFLIIHFKPEGLPEEIDETSAKDLSGGLDASDQAFDFWIPDGAGISGNNGVISLYDRPGGKILDGVLYSNRTSDSDESYGGFGTLDSWERAQELVADGGWIIAGEQVRSGWLHRHPLHLPERRFPGYRHERKRLCGYRYRRRLAHRADSGLHLWGRKLG
jgi:hypothetical protein